MNRNFFRLPSIETTPFKSIYPAQFGVEIEFPLSVDYKGHTYYNYEKYGVDRETGLPCANYKCGNDERDRRLWLLCDGTIKED